MMIGCTPSQRRGWYLAGVGERAGSALAVVASGVVAMIVDAEAAIAADDSSTAVDLITRIAESLFTIDTFTPETKELAPETSVKWRSVLAHWLSGRASEELIGNRDDIVQFIESDLAYRLVWGMEAARVYEKAQLNPYTALIADTATAAVETGTLNPQAAIIIRWGFDYRSAAIKAVESVESTFNTSTRMRLWIRDLPPP